MAKCPKCDRKLRILDVSQFCPACGVNMRFYNFEENFIREAKLAELSQAGLKVRTRNLKYSFSGSKLVTAKLVVPWQLYLSHSRVTAIFKIISDF